MRKPAAPLLAALVAAALLCACAGRREALSYRVTVEVQTPTGLKSGSSVLENRHEAGARRSLRQFQPGKGDLVGEAVAVDLGMAI